MMENRNVQNKNCDDQDSGILKGHDSCGSSVENDLTAMDGEENKNSNDSGNVSGESVSNNKILHSFDGSTKTTSSNPQDNLSQQEYQVNMECAEFCDDRSVQNNVNREFPENEDTFKSKKRPESDCPIGEEDEMLSDESDSSFYIKEGQEPISTIPEHEDSARKKSKFDYHHNYHKAEIPIYSIPVSTVPVTESKRKEIPTDFFYRLVHEKKTDDCKVMQKNPDMIPRVLFDKLARELIKIKTENAALGNENHQLLHERTMLLQQIEEHCKRFDAMCEMDVELYSFKDQPMQENAANPTVMEEVFNQECGEANFIGPKSIDIQEEKQMMNPPETEYTVECLPERPIEYQQDHLDVEMTLRNQIQKLSWQVLLERSKNEFMHRDQVESLKREKILRNKVQESNNVCMEEAKRLEDERRQFRKDIDSLKANKNGQALESPSDSSKKNPRITPKHSKQGSTNSSSGSGSKEKSQYIMQGAIPKR